MKISSESIPNSKQWYAWRSKGLGASDAPAILGASPWTSRFELWAYRTGLLPKPEFNAFALKAVERGNQLEPLACEVYEKMTGLSVQKNVNCEHDQYPFIRASLDGYIESNNTILEIKCPGKIDHAKAIEGENPDKYFP